MEKPVYFKYQDDESGIPYYFNAETQETIWEWPEDAQVLDPETMQELQNEDGFACEHTHNEEEQYLVNEDEQNIEITKSSNDNQAEESFEDGTYGYINSSQNNEHQENYNEDSSNFNDEFNSTISQESGFTENFSTSETIHPSTNSNDATSINTEDNAFIHPEEEFTVTNPEEDTTNINSLEDTTISNPAEDTTNINNDEDTNINSEAILTQSVDSHSLHNSLPSQNTSWKLSPLQKNPDFLLLLDSIPQKTFLSYAETYFREIKSGKMFSKRVLYPCEAISFQEEPIQTPLLKDLPRNQEKIALSSFEIIQTANTESEMKSRLFKLLFENKKPLTQTLHDEIFCQLLKQLNKNPFEESVAIIVSVFIVLGSTILPSKPLREVILHFLSLLLKQSPFSHQITNQIALLFFRLYGIYASEKPLFSNPPDCFNMIESQNHYFKVTIWEIMLKQSSPLEIPIILDKMTKRLFELHVDKVQGIFRHPGSMKSVNDILNKTDIDLDHFLDGLSVHDVASLLKKWFRALPGGLISESERFELNQVIGNFSQSDIEKDDENANLLINQCVDFAEHKISKPNQLSLKYLVGFLKHMSTYADTTLMDKSNLGMVFGPSIIYMSDSENSEEAALYSSLGQYFLTALLLGWNVSFN